MKHYFLSLIIIALAQTTIAQNSLKSYTLKGHQAAVTQAKFSQNGQWLVSADKNNIIKVWDVITGECLQTIHKPQKRILDVTISATGGLIAASSVDKTVRVWFSNTGKLIFQKRIGYATDLQFNPQNEYQLLISKNADKLNPLGLLVGQVSTFKVGVIQLWNIYSKKKISQTKIRQNVRCLDFDPKGRYVVAADNANKLSFINIQHNLYLKSIQQNDRITQVKFDPEGKYIAISNQYNKISIFSIDNGNLFKTIQLSAPAHLIRFIPNNKYMIVVDENQHIQVHPFLSKKQFSRKINYTQIKDVFVKTKEVLTVQIGQNPEDIILKSYNELFQTSNNIYIQQYVEAELREWQQKGKFEKSADYVKRVTEANRQKQVKLFTQKAINNLAQKNIRWKKAKNEYDADNETYKITIDNTYTFYLKVPLKEAKHFDDNFDDLSYENPQFTIDAQGKFQLMHVELKNSFLNKSYVYNNSQQVAFNSNQLNIKFEPIKVTAPRPKPTRTVTQPKVTSKVTPAESPKVPVLADVDQTLPRTSMQNRDAIAVVIGNRNYLKTKEVKFAINDAKSIKNYLINVLGFQEGNIYYQENATKGDFEVLFGNQSNHQGKLYNTVKAGKSDVFVFYSGHGAPDTKNFKGYFVPVECDPQYVSLAGYSIDLFYKNLAKLPAKSVTVVLDACFSGAQVLKNISPIGIKSKGIKGVKNGVLLASSQGTQVSSWYNARQHGLFTYFFLKAIHNKNADVNQDNQLTFKEIYKYIADKTEGIPYWARRLHNVEQTPALQGKNAEKVLVKY